MSKETIKLSVLCITYNQAKYIRQTLDSFLMQKTNFSFEVLINDDGSTDGTVEIIKEYQQKYPKVIKPIFQNENLYSKGIRNMIIRFLLPVAKGEYLAICEGDDYWTNPNKLQIQSDFLDKHPKHSLCFHPVKIIFENDKQKEEIFPDKNTKNEFTTEQLIKANFIQTNSVVYRRQNYKNMATDLMPGDWYLHLYHAQFGKIGYINKAMAVYRRHEGGVWWNSHKNIKKIWVQYGISHLKLYNEMLKIYGNNKVYREAIYDLINKMFINLTEAGKGHNSLVLQAIKELPEVTNTFILNQSIQYHKNNALLVEKNNIINTLKWETSNYKELLSQRNIEISNIKASRFWKLRNIIVRFFGKKSI